MSVEHFKHSKMAPKIEEKFMSSITPVWTQSKASSNAIENVATLQFPPYFKLKWQQNYEQWKNNMENIALAKTWRTTYVMKWKNPHMCPSKEDFRTKRHLIWESSGSLEMLG